MGMGNNVAVSREMVDNIEELPCEIRISTQTGFQIAAGENREPLHRNQTDHYGPGV